MTTWWGSWNLDDLDDLNPFGGGKDIMKKLGTKAVAGYWGPLGSAGFAIEIKKPITIIYTHQMSPCPYPAMSGQNITIYDHVPDTERKKERARERETERGRGRLDFTHDDATFQCIALHNIHAAHFTSHIG
jgi:hypothetical protein